MLSSILRTQGIVSEKCTLGYYLHIMHSNKHDTVMHGNQLNYAFHVLSGLFMLNLVGLILLKSILRSLLPSFYFAATKPDMTIQTDPVLLVLFVCLQTGSSSSFYLLLKCTTSRQDEAEVFSLMSYVQFFSFSFVLMIQRLFTILTDMQELRVLYCTGA